MPVNQEFVGRVYPPTPYFEIGREAIRSFAEAVATGGPVHPDHLGSEIGEKHRAEWTWADPREFYDADPGQRPAPCRTCGLLCHDTSRSCAAAVGGWQASGMPLR